VLQNAVWLGDVSTNFKGLSSLKIMSYLAVIVRCSALTYIAILFRQMNCQDLTW